MAVKYHCRKCGKRYIDWGAEKLGFKCPDCNGEELVRLGQGEERGAKRPSLRRRASRKAAATLAVPDESDFGADLETELEDTAGDGDLITAAGTDETEGEMEYDMESAAPADVDDVEETDFEVTEDLAFDDVTPAAPEEEAEEQISDEWPQ
jgi:DNA-directed RNA polymerase subunit RPC12/RpoP